MFNLHSPPNTRRNIFTQPCLLFWLSVLLIPAAGGCDQWVHFIKVTVSAVVTWHVHLLLWRNTWQKDLREKGVGSSVAGGCSHCDRGQEVAVTLRLQSGSRGVGAAAHPLLPSHSFWDSGPVGPAPDTSSTSISTSLVRRPLTGAPRDWFPWGLLSLV